MKLTTLSVSNYRALRDVTIPLSRFGCLIGANNSGKSSILQALALFFSGSKLTATDYFDDSQPIRIAVTFEDVGEADLARLAEEHRTRVAGIVKNGCLTLVRHYGVDGKSSLLYCTPTPVDVRFSADNIGTLLKNQRPGDAFARKVRQAFPELADTVDATMNQDVVKQKIQELADSLPDDKKRPTDQPLPTGIDKSIVPMLPDPIYVPAVKDLSDEVKTNESTPFGKILAILLRAVESKLPEAPQLFKALDEKLNRVQQRDGTITDTRLDEVKLIESTVEKYVRDSFGDVKVRVTIPPPELKSVFSSARIYANDGVDGLIDSKGDGLRRAIVLSILRSYVELKEKLALASSPAREGTEPTGLAHSEPGSVPTPYLLLFEEPELFLHPRAQHSLFDALRVFSKEHHVLVTTHSPLFFGPGATETFVKLHKKSDAATASKPFTHALPIDLSEVNSKDQFQIICFENNHAAFFAETVILVEGDSDYLVMPHVARTLNSDWDVAKTPTIFVRVAGKGNIRRYREFFAKFGARVAVIADLDLLVSGIEHVTTDDAIREARAELLARVDALIVPDADAPSAEEAKTAHGSGELRGLWRRVKETGAMFHAGHCTEQECVAAVEAFFAWQRKSDRLTVLKSGNDAETVRLMHRLLDMLRTLDVYVLERGEIEDYYPAEVTGADKPSCAQDFCAKVTTRDAMLACCGEQVLDRGGTQVTVKEFEIIFGSIFAESS